MPMPQVLTCPLLLSRVVAIVKWRGRAGASLSSCAWKVRALEIVITSEARNLLLFGPGATAGEKQIPHRLKSVRDDNSKITCLAGTLGRLRSWKARTPWPPA